MRAQRAGDYGMLKQRWYTDLTSDERAEWEALGLEAAQKS
jgi:hypothetical protein